MDPAEWDNVRRLLVVRLDNLGDVVLLGPAIRALKNHLPDVHITALVSKAGTRIAPLVPGIDDAIAYTAEWQNTVGESFDPAETRALIDTLAEERFDAAVIFSSFSQSPYPAASACFLAGIPMRIGQSKEFGGALLTHWVTPLPDSVHVADRNLYLLETAGVPSAGTRLALRLPDAARNTASAVLESQGLDRGVPLVVAAPGASCPARRYPVARFSEAIAHVARRAAVRIAVVGSAREAELADEVAAATPDAVSLAGLLSLPETCALVEHSHLVICQNSAPVHIADALDRAVLVLYSGAEETEQWRPRHAPSVLLNRAVDCAPCHLFVCPREMECLDVSPEEVADRAVRLLELGDHRPSRPAQPEPALAESLR